MLEISMYIFLFRSPPKIHNQTPISTINTVVESTNASPTELNKEKSHNISKDVPKKSILQPHPSSKNTPESVTSKYQICQMTL